MIKCCSAVSKISGAPYNFLGALKISGHHLGAKRSADSAKRYADVVRCCAMQLPSECAAQGDNFYADLGS